MNSSRFYTPNMPNTQFDPKNWSSYSIDQIARDRSRLIFHLPLNCYGNISSVQTCLRIKNGTRGKILELTSYVKEDDRFRSDSVTLKLNAKSMKSCIQKKKNSVCCPILNISEAATYTNSTIISIEILQRSQIRFVRSNFMTNFTLCTLCHNDRSMKTKGPSFQCVPSYIFPVLTRIMIGKNMNSSNLSLLF